MASDNVVKIGGNNVFQLPPKQRSGIKRNCKWKVTYDRITKKWKWEVEVTLKPEHFYGEADTEAAAMKIIDEKLKLLCH